MLGLAWSLRFEDGSYLVLPHTASLGEAVKAQQNHGALCPVVIRVLVSEMRHMKRRPPIRAPRKPK